MISLYIVCPKNLELIRKHIGNSSKKLIL